MRDIQGDGSKEKEKRRKEKKSQERGGLSKRKTKKLVQKTEPET